MRHTGLMSITRRAMACDFALLLPAATRRAVEAGCAALDEVDRLEDLLSAYRPASAISRINAHAAEWPVEAGEEVLSLLDACARLTRETGGAFDIAGGALAKAWGFYAGPKRVPDGTELRTALDAAGMRHVEIDRDTSTVRFRSPGVELNLGAIGKGYAIDCALCRLSLRPALMEAGRSSVKGIGAPPGEPAGWPVAIGDPFRAGRAIGVVRLRDRALGTSSAANRYFMHDGRRYGHILDPRTGRPAAEVASASALAPTAAEADALSTAFYVLGVEATREYCRRRPEVGAVLVTNPGARGAVRVIAFAAPLERSS